MLNDKHWTYVKAVWIALNHNKKAADIIKALCSKKNYAQKYQIIKFPAVGNFGHWPKESRKDEYYINEGEMYDLVSLSQQPESGGFRKYHFNTLFPHICQQLTKKVEEDHQQVMTGMFSLYS